MTHGDQLQELLIQLGLKYAAEALPVLLKQAAKKSVTPLMSFTRDTRDARAL